VTAAPLLVLLAAAPASTGPAPDDTGDVGTAGPTGLALTVVLLIAVALLVRSMSKHLKRIPPSFDTDDLPGRDDVPPVPDSPAELLEPRADGRREPGEDLLDQLRRAPRAIEPPRPDRSDRPDDASGA
jgi:hypothetical protein